MNIPNLIERLDEMTARRIKSWPHPTNRASEAGHPCERFLVLVRLHPEKMALHDVGLQRVFDEGNLHEAAVLRELEDAGFRLVEQQRPFSWEKFQLTGRIDAKIQIDGQLIPLEIKSVSPNVFQAVKKMEPADFLKARQTWLRRYPAQILLYMLMDGKEFGIIIFKNKVTGEKCQKVFQLTDENLEYVESILKKLERVNEYVAKKEVPPVVSCDECRGCGFEKTACFPDRDFGPGFDLVDSPELLEKLERWDELKPLVEEFEALDRELKEKFRGKSAIIGDFKIESIERTRKSFEIPDEVKKQFETTASYIVVKIERL